MPDEPITHRRNVSGADSAGLGMNGAAIPDGSADSIGSGNPVESEERWDGVPEGADADRPATGTTDDARRAETTCPVDSSMSIERNDNGEPDERTMRIDRSAIARGAGTAVAGQGAWPAADGQSAVKGENSADGRDAADGGDEPTTVIASGAAFADSGFAPDSGAGNDSGVGTAPASDWTAPTDFAPTVEFPAVRRRRRGLTRILAVIIVLALVAVGFALVDQRRALAACKSAENEWTEASAAAVAAGAERKDPPAVCPSNAFGSDLRQYAAQLDDDAQALRIRAAELKAKREAEQEARRKAAQEKAKASQSDDASSDGTQTDDSSAAGLQSAKSALEATLTEAQGTLDRLDQLGASPTVKALLQGAYQTAKNLFDASGVKDTRYYKAAAVTLQEAVDAANQWIDSQAAKAE